MFRFKLIDCLQVAAMETREAETLEVVADLEIKVSIHIDVIGKIYYQLKCVLSVLGKVGANYMEMTMDS